MVIKSSNDKNEFLTISSIEENIFQGKVSIFPNPSNNVLNLDMVGVNSSIYSLKLMNLLGEVVYSSSIDTDGDFSDVLDISMLESSTYIIKIENEDYVFTEKIIIK